MKNMPYLELLSYFAFWNKSITIIESEGSL